MSFDDLPSMLPPAHMGPPADVLRQLSELERKEVHGMLVALRRGDDGWNLRCNVCGAFGALWRRDPEVRTATGDLAACRKCYAAIRKELERFRKERDRHLAEMSALTIARFPVQPEQKTISLAFRTAP